jgi:hypothetical protein
VHVHPRCLVHLVTHGARLRRVLTLPAGLPPMALLGHHFLGRDPLLVGLYRRSAGAGDAGYAAPTSDNMKSVRWKRGAPQAILTPSIVS